MRQIALFLLLVCCLNVQADSLNAVLEQPIWVFEDKHHEFDASQVADINQKQWTKHNHNSFNLGYNTSSVWLKVAIQNRANKDNLILLDLTYPLLDYIDLYRVTPNESDQVTLVVQSGDRLPFKQRAIQHPNYVYPVELQPNQKQQFLINIKSHSPIQSQLLLWTPDQFQKHYRNQASQDFFYLGLIFSAAFLNIMIFVFLKEIIFLVYAAYAICFALFVSSQNAVLFEYLMPNTPNLHNWMQLIIACVAVSLTALFNLFFLKLPSSYFSAKALTTLAIFPMAMLVISPIFGFAATVQSVVLSTLLIIPSCFVIGVINSKEKPQRRLFILAWTWLILGVLAFILLRLGVIPLNSLTDNAIQIGSSLQMLTFAAALARRIHSEREIRLHAQSILLESTAQAAKLHKKNLYNSTHFPITGLPNQTFFNNWLKQYNQEAFTLVIVKLTRIQEIDKTLGRDISDRAIELFSMRLNNAVQSIPDIQVLEPSESYFCSTLSANSHAFIIRNQNKDAIITELRLLSTTVNQPLNLGPIEIDPWAKFAFASYPIDGEDYNALFRHARIAMDMIENNSGSIMAYNTDIDGYSERRLRLMNDLKAAIAHDELELYYQPFMDSSTNQIMGAESLLRWPHKEYGMIMPDEFIAIAEQTEIIHALSLWVIKTGLQQLKIWQQDNPDFVLSFNISAQNLTDDVFFEELEYLLESDQINNATLVMEITETQMMSDTQNALRNLWRLSELGIRIAIDDFGTGYSSLSYLKQLPATELKIDKSFIFNLEDDDHNQILVRTVVQMAHNFGLIVVAEGVESERCYQILKQLGCDICQGYHFSRPVPADTFSKLLNLTESDQSA